MMPQNIKHFVLSPSDDFPTDGPWNPSASPGQYPPDEQLSMAPAALPPPDVASTGPHPSFVQVAKQYVFQQQLQGQLVATGTNPTREDTFRLQGVQWINDVRTALQL